MLKDGEKYACKACIRGHRVSSCQHADRELHHINKKGRPVSQCHHCRGLRKSRTAHIKCDCGEHHHKDGDLLGFGDSKDDCPCHTGARCTCAFKKDVIDADEISKLAKPVHHKPLFHNRRSEGAIPKAKNGTHHPPLHRTNNSAHQFGIPYTIRRLHSDDMASDTLFSSSYNMAFDSQNNDDLNIASYPVYIPSSPHDTRLTRSAHASPVLGPVQATDLSNDLMTKDLVEGQTPLWSSYLNPSAQFNSLQRHSITDFSNFSLDALAFPDFGDEPSMPMPSNNTTIEADWSSVGLDAMNGSSTPDDFFPQPPSNASLDFSASGRPGLSHSSSGTASDVGEPIVNDYSNTSNPFGATTLDPSYGMMNLGPAEAYDLNQSSNQNVSLLSTLGLENYDESDGNIASTVVDSATLTAPPKMDDISVSETYSGELPAPSSLRGLSMPNIPDEEDDSIWPTASPFDVFADESQTAAFSDNANVPHWI